MDYPTGPRLPPPRAVLWDLDGTLIDQTEPILRCFHETVVALGHAAPAFEAIRRSMGGPMAETMALLLPPEDHEEAVRRFRERFPEIMFNGLLVLPGATELLAALHAAEVPQIVLTNKHGETARQVCQYAGFSPFLKGCIGHGDTYWEKPDPELTLYAVECCQAGPAAAIVIGDSPTDVASARGAGLGCYAVTTGAHEAAELEGAGADAVFPDLPTLHKNIDL